MLFASATSRIATAWVLGALAMTAAFTGGSRAHETADREVAVPSTNPLVVASGHQPLSAEEIAMIRDETAGRGILILRDGDVLRGRVLSEGVFSLPGARVHYESGTHIVSSGPVNVLLAEMVPLPAQERTTGDDTSSRAEGGVAGSNGCEDYVTLPPSPDGADAADLSCTVDGDLALDADQFFRHVHGGNAPRTSGVGEAGAPSVNISGGTGGDGANVKIVVGGTLTISGKVENGRGGDGGEVQASGADGLGCGACGGHAEATGGNGGRAGSLHIEAQAIKWEAGAPNASLVLWPGGSGGRAFAKAGNGGICDPNECGDGGDGGEAKAVGGDAGDSNRVTIKSGSFEPDLREFVQKHLGLPRRGGKGGQALAVSGHGGHGGPLCPCQEEGGSGGDAGDAQARGGDGGAGINGGTDFGGDDPDLLAEIQVTGGANPQTTRVGTDGGDGGNAEAIGGGGGTGWDAAVCPCDYDGFAGDGGDGGDAGDAKAIGGWGGDARGQTLSSVTAGNGGKANLAYIDCYFAGKPGAGGSCDGDEPPKCKPGFGGYPGSAGRMQAQGGFAGDALDGALPGADGEPDFYWESCHEDFDFGEDGIQHCPLDDDPCGDPASEDCCLPNDSPGCADGPCCHSVCEIAPFCCDIGWNEKCAMLAAELCPWLECGTPPDDCPWDLNGDGMVDLLDLQLLLSLFGPCPDCNNCKGDFNGDCVVDEKDQAILMANFGFCGPPGD